MRSVTLSCVVVSLLAAPCIGAGKDQDDSKVCAAPWKSTRDADKARASKRSSTNKPENIVIAVDKDENIYYNNVRVRDMTELRNRFMAALRRAIATHSPLPEVHIRDVKGGKAVPFQVTDNAACFNLPPTKSQR